MLLCTEIHKKDRVDTKKKIFYDIFLFASTPTYATIFSFNLLIAIATCMGWCSFNLFFYCPPYLKDRTDKNYIQLDMNEMPLFLHTVHGFCFTQCQTQSKGQHDLLWFQLIWMVSQVTTLFLFMDLDNVILPVGCLARSSPYM